MNRSKQKKKNINEIIKRNKSKQEKNKNYIVIKIIKMEIKSKRK